MRKPNEVWQKAELFQQFWEAKYAPEPFIINGMVLKWAKELVGIDNDLIYQRWKIFSEDDWYGENTRHSLPAFVKNFNSFVAKSRRKDGTWKREEAMPMKEVAKLFAPIADSLSVVKKSSDPNGKYKCVKCGGLFKNVAEHQGECNGR